MKRKMSNMIIKAEESQVWYAMEGGGTTAQSRVWLSYRSQLLQSAGALNLTLKKSAYNPVQNGHPRCQKKAKKRDVLGCQSQASCP
jgi:hypothetical protein